MERNGIKPPDHELSKVAETVPKIARTKRRMLYTVEETPRWYLCIFLGFQQFLAMLASTVTTPYIIGPALCMTVNDVGLAYILSTIFFTSAIITLIQTIFGVRLPIVQGSSASFYAPIFAIMSLPEWKCPTTNELSLNATNVTNTDEIWQSRMREVQGAITIAALLPVVLSSTGLIAVLLRFITPLVVVPTVTLIGLSLLANSAEMASQNWPIAVCTTCMMILCSQFLHNVPIPYPNYKRRSGITLGWFQWFKYFPIITVLLFMWLLCSILTTTNVLPPGNGARTDIRSELLQKVDWFRIPYPGQWGMPTFNVASVIGMLSGVIATIIESIGDYYSCARLSGAPPPPNHAISRGILIEGIGGVLAGVCGTGTGTTSYADNIGAISITKVGSRRVIQCATIFMFLCAVVTKIGGVLVTIPTPIVGGLTIFTFCLITAIGLSNVQFVDLNSSRNIFVLGFPLFIGLSIPGWITKNPGCIKTGNEALDNVITVVLSTGMLLGGVLGFILDNTIPGTAEERGIVKWNQMAAVAEGEFKSDQTLYDFPFGMKSIEKVKAFRYIPICPTFVTPKWLQQKPETTNDNSNSHL